MNAGKAMETLTAALHFGAERMFYRQSRPSRCNKRKMADREDLAHRHASILEAELAADYCKKSRVLDADCNTTSPCTLCAATP